MPPASTSTGLSITNPLVLYRALLSTKRIDPDPAQHRLALHLQKLYERLKDYEPVVQYGHRLQQISRTLGSTPGRPAPGAGHEEPRGGSPAEGLFGSLFKSKSDVPKEGMALTKVMTSQEAALNIDSPKGLMLHGEVGTGKSMLIDLFADCLPNRKKKRWHYTSFMLHTIHKLEQLRRSRQLIIPSSLGQGDDYSLLWLAREMISTSPILFLDEFQLPDRAAAKIMTNLMTCFFHLGGVLIATSNRMPEELAKAAGLDFTQPPPSRMEALAWSVGLSGGRKVGGQKRNDFAQFLEVLKARCEVWEMESKQDYRRREAEKDAAVEDTSSESSTTSSGTSLSSTTEETDSASSVTSSGAMPRNFFVKPADTTSSDHDTYASSFSKAIISATSSPSADLNDIPWGTRMLTVYGRQVPVPREYNGVSYWTFEELCQSTLGPADYITLASTFHTIILTDVPVLSLLQKNEARRLITLLDALYEARCKLLVSAAAGPDDIFFPESKQPKTNSTEETVEQDQILPETLAEIYQDATAPFRPNISAYSQDPGIASPEEVDGTHARFRGLLRPESGFEQSPDPPPDQLEDTPPNSLTRERNRQVYGTVDTGDGIENRAASPALAASLETATGSRGPDFQKSGIFTGEDERFAFKRARSRLWEMCGTRWWSRSGDDSALASADPDGVSAATTAWWKPVPESARPWERPASSPPAEAAVSAAFTAPHASEPEAALSAADISSDKDDVLFRHGASPFRGSAEQPPPQISETHVWGTTKWGPKAGRWGEGVDALRKDRGEAPETSEGYVKRRSEWRKREPKDPRRFGDGDGGRHGSAS